MASKCICYEDYSFRNFHNKNNEEKEKKKKQKERVEKKNRRKGENLRDKKFCYFLNEYYKSSHPLLKDGSITMKINQLHSNKNNRLTSN